MLALGIGLLLESVMPKSIKNIVSENARATMTATTRGDCSELSNLLGQFETKPSALYFSEDQYPNAFALPDKSIVFTAEMLGLMDQNSFLGIYAHELGHIELGHTDRLLGRFAIFSHLAGSLFGSAGRYFGEVAFNQYSQVQEADADRFSRAFLLKHKIDPRPTAELFRKLNDAAPHSKLNFLSTHPSNESRVQFFEEVTIKDPKTYLSEAQWLQIKSGCH